MKRTVSYLVAIGIILSLLFSSNINSQAASYDKAYASKNLTVKVSPGTSYKTLGKIKLGTSAKVYSGVPIGKDQENWYSYQQYGWSKIKYGKKYGWVKTHDLTFTNPYSWVPGIKSKTIKDIKKNQNVSKKDKTKLVRSKYETNFYVMYIKFDGNGKWYPFVNINCKTGWYHG